MSRPTRTTTPSPYRVHLTDAAKKDLAAEPGLAPRILRKLATLAERPVRGHPLSGRLAGCRSLELSQKQGGYRAAYYVLDAERLCIVFAIGPHATVYKAANRRYPPQIEGVP